MYQLAVFSSIPLIFQSFENFHWWCQAARFVRIIQNKSKFLSLKLNYVQDYFFEAFGKSPEFQVPVGAKTALPIYNLYK